MSLDPKKVLQEQPFFANVDVGLARLRRNVAFGA